MNTDLGLHAEADRFLTQAKLAELSHSRAVLLHLSEAWESLASAWDALPAIAAPEKNTIQD